MTPRKAWRDHPWQACAEHNDRKAQMVATVAHGSGTVRLWRQWLPIVPRLTAEPEARERARITCIAERIRRDEPGLARTDVFGGRVKCGLGPLPAILLGDQREIGLHESLPVQLLEHRIAMLAGPDDVVVLERESPEYEAYLAALLGLDALHVIAIGPPHHAHSLPVASRCREIGPLLEQFLPMARRHGGLQIIPNIGAGSAWTLAGAISREVDLGVQVAAAPPRLTRRVNDKIWFAAQVREALGPRALPPTFAAFGPAAVAARIAALARRFPRVIIKTPDSAGAMGNLVIDSALIRNRETRLIRRLVLSLLHHRGWRGGFPLLVGVWELQAVSSPSVQMWIPLSANGDPIIEGIFEQRLGGESGEFVGAMPTQLPEALNQRVADEAMRLALLFQHLGYFGRCSFDCLLTGSLDASAGIYWIECNGRWGGVSVPMSLVNRLYGGHAGRGMVIVQSRSRPLAVRGFAAAQARLGSLLLRRGADEGILPLSAEGLEQGIGLQLLAVAATQQRAEELASQGVQLLTDADGAH